MEVLHSSKPSLLSLVFVTALSGSPSRAQESAAKLAEAITINVVPGARQTFAGFGTSLGNWGGEYQQLTPTERTSLSQLLWRGLNFKILRLWLNLDEYAPENGPRTLARFRGNYVDSGIIADAKKQGVTTLLLAPDAMPLSMKIKREGGPGDYTLKDEAIVPYANLVADFIGQLRRETGVLIDVTGLQNEPNDLDRIAPEQMAPVLVALRAALDARDLKTVKIIAPESANVDGVFYDQIDRVKADVQAWQSIAGISSHSYNMAATDEAARRIEAPNGANTKEYWMTEASANGPEEPGDALQAVSLASRFLNDMNHRTTHWVHFLGFEVPDPNDNATRILSFTPKPLKTRIFQKYHYYQQLSQAFEVGAVFRDSQSSLDGDMTWTYGKKPRVFAAAAQNSDGTWAVGLTNFTAPTFNDDPNETAGYANGYKSRDFKVTLEISEIARAGQLEFEVHRSSATQQNVRLESVTMRNGTLTLPLGPMELLTLRSKKPYRLQP